MTGYSSMKYVCQSACLRIQCARDKRFKVSIREDSGRTANQLTFGRNWGEKVENFLLSTIRHPSEQKQDNCDVGTHAFGVLQRAKYAGGVRTFLNLFAQQAQQKQNRGDRDNGRSQREIQSNLTNY